MPNDNSGDRGKAGGEARSASLSKDEMKAIAAKGGRERAAKLRALPKETRTKGGRAAAATRTKSLRHSLSAIYRCDNSSSENTPLPVWQHGARCAGFAQLVTCDYPFVALYSNRVCSNATV